MKKNRPKYFEYFCEWSDSGLPDTGICNSLPKRMRQQFEFIMKPDIIESKKLQEDGFSVAFWGTGIANADNISLSRTLTPLRQNLVLLMAALNNEL